MQTKGMEGVLQRMSAEDRQRAALAGFDGYVEKPISVRELPGQIEAFLGRAV